MIPLIFASLSASLAGTAFGNIPAPTPVPLFRIVRSSNANELHYVMDPASGQIEAYWTMLAEDGRREELNWIEKKMAYGFSLESNVLRVKALEARPIEISDNNGTPRAEMVIRGKPSVLKEVFVKVAGGLFPGAEYIELIGTDLDQGAEVREVIRP